MKHSIVFRFNNDIVVIKKYNTSEEKTRELETQHTSREAEVHDGSESFPVEMYRISTCGANFLFRWRCLKKVGRRDVVVIRYIHSPLSSLCETIDHRPSTIDHRPKEPLI
jgi:hypothetical protein